jgi:uncharacterized membrane protein
MRRALARVGDVDAGSAVIATVAFALVAATAVASGSDLDAGELWPFLLIGTFVPGLSQLLVVYAVQAAGASRAGILFGMAPLFSALIAIAAFGEPLRWPLVAGTLLVVAGGVALAWEHERPVDYRAYGAALAVTVAVAFGLRDNVARTASEDVAADPLAQAAAIMLGASIVLLANLLRQPSAVPRLRTAFAPYASSGAVRGARPGTRDRRRAARGHGRALDGRFRGHLSWPRRASRQTPGRCGPTGGRRKRARGRNSLSWSPFKRLPNHRPATEPRHLTARQAVLRAHPPPGVGGFRPATRLPGGRTPSPRPRPSRTAREMQEARRLPDKGPRRPLGLVTMHDDAAGEVGLRRATSSLTASSSRSRRPSWAPA